MARNKRYAEDMAGCVAYWERIHFEINSPLPRNPSTLQEGLWPLSDWTRDHKVAFADVGADTNNPLDTTPEDETEPYPYCGPAKDRPKLTFNPFRDVLLGDFVLCRPCDNNYLPVWLGRVLECVDMTPGPSFGNFKIEWWTPMKARREGKVVVARECWTRRWLKELCLLQIVHVNIVLYSHRMPSHAKKGPPTSHVIPEASVVAAIANLEAAGVAIDRDANDAGDDGDE